MVTATTCPGGLNAQLDLRLATEVPLIYISRHHLGSVDCWHCQIFSRSLGTTLLLSRALCACCNPGFLLSRGVCDGLVIGGNADPAPLRTAPWGTQWGQLNRSRTTLAPCVLSMWATLGLFRRLPAWFIPLLRGLCLRAPAPGSRIVTWLILPVVICLSQRLSHACLSISNYTVKLRMAH